MPSLAIIGGVTIQDQDGAANSFSVDMNSMTVPLQPSAGDSDLAVSPFVGAKLELMSPALELPMRPRFFASAEILPTFASDRDLAVEGNPSCVRGPEPDAPCAHDPGGLSGQAFDASSANGQGTSLIAKVDTLVFGANVGAAFPLQYGSRQLRIKPSVGWISFEVEADGLVVDAACGDPTAMPPSIRCNDFLRETVLTANDSKRYHGIGPGLDVELDTGRFGPIGSAIFMGGRAYAILGDRDFSFATSRSFDDVLGMDGSTAQYQVDVDPWMFLAHVGIRFQWLGDED